MIRHVEAPPADYVFHTAGGTPIAIDTTTGRLYILSDAGEVLDCLLLSAGPVWDDLRFPISLFDPLGGVAAPSLETDLAKFPGSLLFSATAINLIAHQFQMPHAWADGTAIRPHIHWTKTTSAVGAVVWQYRWRKAGIGQAFSAWSDWLPGVSASVNGAEATADTHYITSFGLHDMTGLSDSSMVSWQLQRVGNDAGDTYAATARLLEFDVHYQIDRLGSVQEFPAT